MRIPTYRFDHDIELYVIGDVHYGDNQCNRELFRRTVNEVSKTENAYWCSPGDLLNVAIPGSKSNPSTSISLEQEQDELESILKQIASKCLGFVGSNHHHRVKKTIGYSLDKNLSKIIGIPYLGALGIFNVVCGRCSYFTAMHHGVGGGKKPGGKTNSLDDLSKLAPGADLYLEGHSHFYDAFHAKVLNIDRKRLITSYHPATLVSTASYLEYEGSYAMDLKLEPKPLGCAKVTLYANNSGNADHKKIKVELYS